MNTGLYGLIHSNRTSEDHWGKNCFNSSFPAALCCYMLDKQIPALYLVAKNKDGKTFSYLDEIDIRDLFGMKATLSLNDL